MSEIDSHFCEGAWAFSAQSNFWPPTPHLLDHRIDARLVLAAAPSLCRIGYSARVDRFDAIRLLKALVAAGAKPRAPMDRAWIDEIAVRDVSLHGTELASALAYAEGQRWLADSRRRKDWIYLTRTGEIVAKESV